MKFLLSAFFWPFYALIFISAAFPTPIGNFDFVHVSEKNSLTLNISKNSPPLAALTDQNRPAIKMEPEQELQTGKRIRILSAGLKPAWPKLQKVSAHFEKSEVRKIRRHQLVIDIIKTHIEPKPTRISELINLLEPVNYAYHSPSFEVRVPQSKEVEKIAKVEEVVPAISYVIPPSIHRIERELPRGENAPAKIAGHVAQMPSPIAQQKMIDAVAKEQPKRELHKKVMGQVQLTGGLAMAGDINKLNVQWKTGLESIDADLDSSTGRFVLSIPTLQGGKIIASLTDGRDHVLGRGEFELDGVATPDQNILDGVKVVVDPLATNTRGIVVSAYSYDDVKIPVKNSEVFAPSQIRERADASGRYKISSLGAGSTFVLDAHAPEHWGTRVISETQKMETVLLFSNKMMQSLFDLMQEPDNNTELGVIWGEVKRKNKSKEGVAVSIGTPGAIGPIYFNELRLPDKKLKKTSPNGLFAFIKVPPGLNIVSSRIGEVELPSKVIATAPTMVSYAEINLKSLTLQGKVIDPVLKQSVSAQISVVGASQGTKSDADGFQLKIPSTDSVIYLDAHAGEDFLVSRTAVARSTAKDINMYSIRKAWLADIMIKGRIKNHESMGMLLGVVTGPQFHVSFENEKISDDQIHYLDKEGNIDPGAANSPVGGGTFLVTNLKPGLHTAVLTSADGEMTKSQILVSEAGVLNILNTDLRP